MFAALDWSADDDIPRGRWLVRSRTAGVLCGLGIRARRVSQNSRQSADRAPNGMLRPATRFSL
jgi:hypothetical protein